MVRINQVQAGFCRYVDDHVAVAFDGWKKIAVSAGAALLSNNVAKIAEQYPLISMLGVYNASEGTVDIDALHSAIVDRIGNEKLSIPITQKESIKLGRADIDALVGYIKGA